MATSAAMRAFTWGDGLQVAAQDIRLGQISALTSGVGGPSGSPLAVGSGVRYGSGNPLGVAVSTGLSVTVNPGFAIVQGSAAANSGAYSTTLDSTATLTCATADPVNPRIDSVAVTVTDLGSSSSTAVVQIVTGTAAASPTAPTLPANSLRLCNITVAANATSLIAGNLADQRLYSVASGGIAPVQSSAFYPSTGPGSQYLHNMATGRLVRYNGTTVLAPSTAAFAPAQGTPASFGSASTSFTNGPSATVTVDGSTEVRVTMTWKSVTTSGTVAGNNGTLQVARGATVVGAVVIPTPYTNGTITGASAVFWETPPAGTYTYTMQIANQGAGTFNCNTANILVEAMSP